MKTKNIAIHLLSFTLLLAAAPFAVSQSAGLAAITAEDIKIHLDFLGAREFHGRNTPSAELDIASKYIALTAQRFGLKPLMPGGSYYQDVPMEVTSLSPAKSRLRLISGAWEQVFYFPQTFASNIRGANEGSVSGDLVFLGYGLSAPALNWDDYGDVNLKGKIAVILDVPLPKDHILKPTDNRALISGRSRAAREKGAWAVITVIPPERENAMVQKGVSFDIQERLKFLDVDMSQPAAPAPPGQVQTAPSGPFYQIDVRHDTAAALLGVSKQELDRMFESIGQGRPVSRQELAGKRLEISLVFDHRKTVSWNVVGYIEGSDPSLRKEYVVIGAHHDHVQMREGRIFPGADDNASGSVGLLELAKALRIEHPKRSVILVWHTAEEKGLVGAYSFVQHSPVPVENISACLNLDMLTRNDPDGIYLIGSDKVSTELDKSIRSVNDRVSHLKLDYSFNDSGHPDRFFFRSDQFPYIRYGVPGVWFFCGTTEDYHQEGDVTEKCDLKKMLKVTRLVYGTAMDIGNKPRLLKLDANPEITSRGKQNFKVDWWKPLRESRPQQR